MDKILLDKLLIAASLLTLVTVYVAPAFGDSEVRLTGFRLEDHTDISEPVVVAFELLADAPIAAVRLSYVNVSEKWANTSLILTEGDHNDGWWNATIPLKIQENKTDVRTLRYIPNPMTLYVTLPQKVIELEIPQSYFPMTAFKIGDPLISPTLAPILLAIGGVAVIAIFAVIATILSKRKLAKKAT